MREQAAIVAALRNAPPAAAVRLKFQTPVDSRTWVAALALRTVPIAACFATRRGRLSRCFLVSVACWDNNGGSPQDYAVVLRWGERGLGLVIQEGTSRPGSAAVAAVVITGVAEDGANANLGIEPGRWKCNSACSFAASLCLSLRYHGADRLFFCRLCR